eukprot:CAMPEP_0177677436 /NCGR_PEP_ID=MMETSP0447-20121125/28392_1 /TAXON_ID=0 /ORGANISM="Stygamoeba regulata, Strain BSH-02190019" /LENGTH=282 /DNA_ID=CAMNT_0019186207 /DNA_START=280 /DNA_END=1127 /DNA_ORIENTATION=+
MSEVSSPSAFQHATSRILSLTGHMFLGSAAGGIVYRGKYQGLQVAVKKLSSDSISFQWKEFLREVAVMFLLDDPLVCKCVVASTDKHDPFIAMPLYSLGSLSNLLGQDVDDERRLHLVLSAAQSCKLLHDFHIIHRDIKPENFLLTSSTSVVVTDMGSMRCRQSELKYTKAVGTPMYMAPEVYLGEDYTEKSDVYSFGMLMLAILHGRLPGSADPSGEIDISFISGMYQTDAPAVKYPDSDHPCKPLVDACLSTTPQARPSFPDVCAQLEALLLARAGPLTP